MYLNKKYDSRILRNLLSKGKTLKYTSKVNYVYTFKVLLLLVKNKISKLSDLRSKYSNDLETRYKL